MRVGISFVDAAHAYENLVSQQGLSTPFDTITAAMTTEWNAQLSVVTLSPDTAHVDAVSCVSLLAFGGVWFEGVSLRNLSYFLSLVWALTTSCTHNCV
jgi:hypothetical protein